MTPGNALASPAAWQRLEAEARALGIALDASHRERLARLLALLLEWNKKINLTSVDRPDEVLDKHFLDSLAAAAAIPPTSGSVLDVGSGAGFPGLVIALVLPKVLVTTVEPIHKKVAFTRQAARELQLANLTARAERLEQLEARHERFDVAVSRATFEPSEWLERAVPMVAAGGLVLAMTTAALPPLAPPPELGFDHAVSYRVEGVAREVRCFLRKGA